MVRASETKSFVISKNEINGDTGEITRSITKQQIFLFVQHVHIASQQESPRGTRNGRNKVKKTTKSGQCVSVDSFESSTAGLTAQLKGSLTQTRDIKWLPSS